MDIAIDNKASSSFDETQYECTERNNFENVTNMPSVKEIFKKVEDQDLERN